MNIYSYNRTEKEKRAGAVLAKSKLHPDVQSNEKHVGPRGTAVVLRTKIKYQAS